MRKTLFSFLTITLLALPGLAEAHAFGQLYVLPLPLWLYLYGGGAALAVSFVLISYFSSYSPKSTDPSTIIPTSWKASPEVIFVGRSISLLLFLVALLSGYLGSQQGIDNFGTIYFWIIFLLGLTYATALLGRVAAFLNPWTVIGRGVARLFPRPLLSYPSWLGYLPAWVGWLLLLWLELLSGGRGAVPATLSTILIGYTVYTALGVIVFGREWLWRAEVFTVLLCVMAEISPIRLEQGHLSLRLPFSGLLRETVDHFTLLPFILTLLAGTAYDGLHDTKPYNHLFLWIYTHLDWHSSAAARFLDTFFLLLIVLAFLSLYLLAMRGIRALIRTKLSTSDLAIRFLPTLLPIVLAYHIAHYFTLLLVQGQTIIPLISDPFNRGWNLFGTAGHQINIGIIGAASIWNVQVAAILIGHIVAVWQAHREALRLFSDRRQATLSQLPLLALMIGYTIIGLWTLSLPLTVGR